MAAQIPKTLIVFTLSYIALAAIAALGRNNLEFVFYIAVVLLLIGLVLQVHKRIHVPSKLLWGLSAWGCLHMIGGLIAIPDTWPANVDTGAVVYNLWLLPEIIKYDHFVHAFGFGLTTLVCWHALQTWLPVSNKQATWGMMIVVLAAGMGFGALNEVIEFIATLMIPETNVGGYINTGWDLVANFVGGILAIAVIKSNKFSN